MSEHFDFVNAIVLNDDELLVINGGTDAVNCGFGCGVGCGGNCGENCFGCTPPEKPVTPTPNKGNPT